MVLYYGYCNKRWHKVWPVAPRRRGVERCFEVRNLLELIDPIYFILSLLLFNCKKGEVFTMASQKSLGRDLELRENRYRRQPWVIPSCLWEYVLHSELNQIWLALWFKSWGFVWGRGIYGAHVLGSGYLDVSVFGPVVSWFSKKLSTISLWKITSSSINGPEIWFWR